MGDDCSFAPCPTQFPMTGKTSKCYWIDNFPISLDEQYAAAALPADVDIAIIGSGITGAAAAYRLSQQSPDLKVAVLEARGICSGATGRNGGHIGRPEVYGLRELAEQFGAEEALRIRELVLRNRDLTVACLQDLDAMERVDLRLNGTIVVFETGEERQAFEDDVKFARGLGYQEECCILEQAEVLEKIAVNPDNAQHGAAFLANCGTMYPRKFVNVLFETALKRMPSLSLHPNTPVSGVSRPGPGSLSFYTVTTNKGLIRAKAVFHATNGYSSRLMPELRGEKGVVGCMAHMLGVQPPSTQKEQLELGVGYADFWHWIQQRPQQGLFLYGLATAELSNHYDDSGTLADDHPVKKEMFELLQNMFPRWFPEGSAKKCVEYDWTGIQGMTHNGASIVGRPAKDSPGEFVSVGHNGEGMTKCFTCAGAVVDAMLAQLRGEPVTVPNWFPRSYWKDEVA